MKVCTVNLERGRPSADAALGAMVDALGVNKRKGCKAVLLIHGWGSSGTGGAIRRGVHKKLRERSLVGLVADFCPGEDWEGRKADFLRRCPHLREFQGDIAGNKGVTVVLLR